MEDKIRDDKISLQNFLNHLEKGYFTVIKCKCGFESILPIPKCPKCGSNLNESSHWEIIERHAIITSYCVTYVGPPELSDLTPYVSLILDFGNDLKVSALLNESIGNKMPPEDLIGKKAKIRIIERNYGKILGAEII